MRIFWKTAALFFIILVFASRTAVGQVVKTEAWPGSIRPADLAEIKTCIDPDPALPVPSIKDSLVKEFTKGSTNTIQWSPAEITRLINDQAVELKFFEVKAEFQKNGQNYLLWGIVDAPDSSATFIDLPEYVEISYYLRYFVQDEGEPGFRMSYWSDPVTSRQDYNPPRLDPDSSRVVNLNELCNQNWVIGRQLSVRISASDLPIGKLELAYIQEEGGEPVSFSLVQNGTLKTMIDTMLYYTLDVPEKTPAVINLWVSDVSLQESEKKTVTLIWMSDEEGRDGLICFPNPFNPENDYCSKIKVGIPGVVKAYIFDPFGNLVRELSKELTADFFTWDGRNGRGDLVSSGGYLCVLDGKRKYYCKIAVYR
ncbi:hypothetical protein JXO52_14115 [bacterium]|nr:hypothetical protein [bacterium]